MMEWLARGFEAKRRRFGHVARMVTESCLRSRQQDWIKSSSRALFVPGDFPAMARLWR